MFYIKQRTLCLGFIIFLVTHSVPLISNLDTYIHNGKINYSKIRINSVSTQESIVITFILYMFYWVVESYENYTIQSSITSHFDLFLLC